MIHIQFGARRFKEAKLWDRDTYAKHYPPASDVRGQDYDPPGPVEVDVATSKAAFEVFSGCLFENQA